MDDPQKTETVTVTPAVERVGLEADHDPNEPGWYAVLVCWDPEEGYFPGARKWSGAWEGDDGPVSSYWPKLFATKDEAEAFAQANEPDW